MKSKISILILLFAAMIGITGCKSSKTATSGDKEASNSSLNAVINAYDKDWDTFISSGKIKFEGSMSLSSSMQVRMRRGHSLSVSIRPLLGIEMAKLVIVEDTILFIDKSQSRYACDQISNILGTRLNLESLQSLFLGRHFSVNGGALKKASDADVKPLDDGTIEIIPREQIAPVLYSFFTDNANNIARMRVEGLGSSALTAYYDYFTATDWGNIPTEVLMTTAARSNSIKIEYNKGSMRWNESFDEKITIPSGYRKAEVKAYLQMLFR